MENSLGKARNKTNFSTSFHPQTDGQIKVFNRSLSTTLRSIMKGNHKFWDEYLPHIEFAYNRVVHKTTNISPFEVVDDENHPTSKLSAKTTDKDRDLLKRL